MRIAILVILSKYYDQVCSMVHHENVNISIRNGLQVEFDLKKRKLEFWGGIFSGKEKVILDGATISEGKSYKTKSSHHFKIDEIAHTIEIESADLLKGEFNVRLYEEGGLIQGYKMNYNRPKTKAMIPIYFLLTVGLVFGFTIASGIVSKFIFSIATFICLFFYHVKAGKWVCEDISVS